MSDLSNNPSFCARNIEPGLLAVLAAFCTWGLLPVYWKLLAHLPPLVIILHRMLWSFVLMGLLLLFRGELKNTFRLLREKRIALAVAFCSALLGFNWFLFTVAINSGVIVQISLAYFMVPILNMLNGVLFFQERLKPLQWAAVALVVCGVGTQVAFFGEVPWLALGLSVSWAAYGAAHKAVRYPAIPGFFLETAAILPIIAAVVFWSRPEGGSALFVSLSQSLLLVGSGIATILPQVWFVFGAQRLRQTTLGLAQFLAPTLFLLVGVLLYGETVSLAQRLGFGFIWAAMLLYSAASLRRSGSRVVG